MRVLRRFFQVPLWVVCLTSVALSCSHQDGPTTGRKIRVPEEVPSIQGAVASAKSGDLILIGPGTYHEKVFVDKEGLTIRGLDRNSVILDGKFAFQSGIEVVADGVVIENLTVRRYNGNGIIFNGIYSPEGVDPNVAYGSGDNALKGYRASYITAYNNGLYGIYAFAARGGQIDHSYASGHPDSGFYIGQCKPCNVVLTDNLAENNSIGYFGTNASGGVYVINSVFRGNRLGVIPNTQELEKLTPQIESVIAGNLVVANGNEAAPPHPEGTIGNGIVVAGGQKNQIIRNRVEGNPGAGILVTFLDGFESLDNIVEGNILEDNGVDLVYSPTKQIQAGQCFRGNTFASSSPVDIEKVIECGADANRAVSGTGFRGPVLKNGPDYKTIAPPAAQPTMPDAETAPARRATELTPKIDLATIVAPPA